VSNEKGDSGERAPAHEGWRVSVDDNEILADITYWERMVLRLGVLLNGAGIAACLGALGSLAGGSGPPKIITLPIILFLMGIFASIAVGYGHILEVYSLAIGRGLIPNRQLTRPWPPEGFSRMLGVLVLISFGCFALGAIIGVVLIIAW
jgi:hypothetical protein